MESGSRFSNSNGTKQWKRLKARIERRVCLAPQPLELGGRHFNWYRVTNPEILLDQAAENEKQPAAELDPFWAATWRAAIGLDRFLQDLALSDVRVLELGCGSGQAGVGAAARGAAVTMTDAVGLALMVARLNAWPVVDRIRFHRLRWDQDRLPVPSFPIIIGSDLVYDPSLFALLSACARQHLADGGRLYLSEPHRHTGDRFSKWVREAGWQTIEHDVDLNDNRIPIRIFECWLSDKQTSTDS
jgi:predicted nicotinamide N-methyase